MTSANDPIERIAVDLEIYGIPQSPDMPQMTETFLHVRRRQNGSGSGVLGLPVYKGDQGDTGPAGMIHKGDRTTAELDGLAMVLDETALNFTYRNTDDDSQWIWTGDAFTVYADAYGTTGDTGPAPALEGGTVTVDGEVQDAPAGVNVSGAVGGPYTIDIALPALPEGEPGPQGDAGPIYTSVDVEGTPDDGDTLVHDETLGKLVWVPQSAPAPVEEYVIPPSIFPTVSKSAGDVRQILCSVTIPERPWAYRLDISGSVDTWSAAGHKVDVEVRLDDAVSGQLVGYGRGAAGQSSWSVVDLHSYSDDAIIPGSAVGVIAADTAVTVYASAVRVSGSSEHWEVRADRANLRLRTLGAG